MDHRGSYIAVDWGTSSRRVFAVSSTGVVCDRLADSRGLLALRSADYPDEIAALRQRFGIHEVIAGGMIGSARGWSEAPYVKAPAGCEDVAKGVVTIVEDARIIPGVASTGDRPDVMRGEETIVLGALSAGLVPPNAMICQPGTHNKWIDLESGRITRFATAMTGELFALLKGGGTLQGMLDGAVTGGDAFVAGALRASGADDLAVALFEARAQVLLGRLDPLDAASYVSGLLIGADVGARRDLAGSTVHLIGAGPLATLYAQAIARAGACVVPVDAEAAFVAGAHTIRSLLQ